MKVLLALTCCCVGGLILALVPNASVWSVPAQPGKHPGYAEGFIHVQTKGTAEEQIEFLMEELQYNWLPQLKDLTMRVQQNEREINELEKALEALEKE